MGVLAVVLIVLLVVFFLLVASVLLPARFRFRATFVGGKFSFDAAVRLPLIPRFLILLSDARLKKAKGREVATKGEAGGDGGPEEAGGSERPQDTRARIEALQRVFDGLRSHYPEVKALTSYVARSVTIREFRIHSQLGTGDAAETALVAGGFRAFAGVALGLLRRSGIRFTKRPEVRILPVFDRAHLSADVEVVSSIVPLRGLIALLRLVKQVRKSKVELRSAVSKPARWNTRA